ncbi:MAG: 4Fe-4S binding protein [Actinomycetota bacterium]|nr:4Fe-4S binding protein [Actinomycetota bacterium]
MPVLLRSMKAFKTLGTTNICSSGFTAVVDKEARTGCGSCEESCPFDAVIVNDDMVADVDDDKCMGCGVCETFCQEGAISLELDPSKPPPSIFNTL